MVRQSLALTMAHGKMIMVRVVAAMVSMNHDRYDHLAVVTRLSIVLTAAKLTAVANTAKHAVLNGDLRGCLVSS